jgi:hypothetical protein
MGSEMMDVQQLAVYLQRDVREVTRLASPPAKGLQENGASRAPKSTCGSKARCTPIRSRNSPSSKPVARRSRKTR